MAGYLKKKNPPPPELKIGLDWRNFGTPYVAGGLRDQPIRFMRRMKLSLYVYDALLAWKFKYTPTPEAEERWHATHEWVVDIVSMVNRMQAQEENTNG